MPYVLKCEACNQQFRVRESFAGRSFKCRKCGHVNYIDDVDVEDPEALPERVSDSEVPVANMLPPVAQSINTRAKRKKEREKKKEQEIDYDLLGGRVGVLGQVDEEEEEERRRVMLQMGGGFGALLLIIVAVGFYMNRINNSPDKLVPKEFEPYRFEEGGMMVDVPVGWEVESLGGAQGIPATLKLKSRKVTFIMRANPRGTIQGGTADALNALGGGMLNDGDTTESVHIAHVGMGTMIANEYVGYEETPPKVIRPTGFGSARICQYQGGTPFGMTEYGFRATIKTGFEAYRILITMPQWLRDDFEPAAKKIIASARPLVEEMDDLDEPEPAEPEDAADENVEVDPFTGEKVPVEPEAGAAE